MNHVIDQTIVIDGKCSGFESLQVDCFFPVEKYAGYK